MGIVLENLTLEDLCDLMCGGPEPEEDEEWEEEAAQVVWRGAVQTRSQGAWSKKLFSTVLIFPT